MEEGVVAREGKASTSSTAEVVWSKPIDRGEIRGQPKSKKSIPVISEFERERDLRSRFALAVPVKTPLVPGSRLPPTADV